MKLLIPVLICLLVCGCVTTTPTNQTPSTAIPPTITTVIPTSEPTPEPTFATSRPLKYHTYAEETPTKVPITITTAPVITTRTPCGNAVWETTGTQLVGKWVLRDGPYPCSAFFNLGGTGTMTCGTFPVIVSKNMVWSNGNTEGTYEVVIYDTPERRTTATIKDGILTAGILPDGSYMVKL